MADAQELLDIYKKNKTAAPTMADEAAKVFVNLFTALGKIANTENPPYTINVDAPSVNVEVPTPSVNIAETKVLNEVKVDIPEIKIPELQIQMQDYTAAFMALTDAVNNLITVMQNRPTSWKVERDNSGFIQKVNGQ